MKPSLMVAAALIVAGTLAHVGRLAGIASSTAPRPDDATVAALGPVVAALSKCGTDARGLAGFYSSLADVLGRDREVLKTTAQLRELHGRAGRLAFAKTGVDGKYPGLAEAIDRYLADRIGLENVAIDDARRTKAVTAFRGLTWACGGGR